MQPTRQDIGPLSPHGPSKRVRTVTMDTYFGPMDMALLPMDVSIARKYVSIATMDVSITRKYASIRPMDMALLPMDVSIAGKYASIVTMDMSITRKYASIGPGRTFLGYAGLLDAMRFALDPQANHFYFGP